jgi:hypothetical protein
VRNYLTGSRYIRNNGKPLWQTGVNTPEGQTAYLDLDGRASELEPSSIESEIPDVETLFSFKRSSLNPITELSMYLKRYIYLSEEVEYDLVSIFLLLSYCTDLFNRIPYLWIQGNKGSGKTTLMAVMKSLISNPVWASETTASALFRIVDEIRPTLFLDESENLKKRGSANQQLFQILNSGYQKDGTVIRTVGSIPTPFKTFGLKILAGINPLFPTLEDRCIVLRLSQPPESIELDYYNGDSKEDSQPLVEIIHSALQTKIPELSEFITNPKDLGIDSKIRLRGFDKWFPILSLAKLFITPENNYFELLQNYAIRQIESKKEAEEILPENMCRGILKDFLEAKGASTKVPEDPNFFFFRTDEIQDIIKNTDPHNSYRDKAELTRILGGIGVETERRRFKGPPLSLYKIPKSILN